MLRRLDRGTETGLPALKERKPGISWMDVIDQSAWQPSSNWAQGGPIIKRENISVVRCDNEFISPGVYEARWAAVFNEQYAVEDDYSPHGDDWGSCYKIEGCAVRGPTPLVAAMRCYVASKLGETVEIPDELLTGTE